MKMEELADAIGAIDPVYVEEAERWKRADGKSGAKRKNYRTWRLKRILPVAACLCVAAAGGIYGVWNDGSPRTEDSIVGSAEYAADSAAEGMESAAESAGLDSAEDTFSDASPEASAATAESPGEDLDMEADGMRVVINEIEELQAAVCDIAETAEERYFTAEELEEYYGVRLLPDSLPEGFTSGETAEKEYTVLYDENGKVINDNIKLSFRNNDTAGELDISVRTTESGEIISFAEPDPEISRIYGRDVTIGHYTARSGMIEESAYLAIFKKGGVTFTLQGRNLSEEDFLGVLENLIQD